MTNLISLTTLRRSRLQQGSSGGEEGGVLRATQVQFTWAKAHLSSLFDAVVGGHGVRVIRRHKSRPLALVGADDLEALLAPSHPFTTEVSRGEDGVSIWVQEFAIFGQGDDLDAAMDDLIDEIDVYLDEWEARLRHAPDHAARAWWVRRLQLAPDRETVRRMLLPASGEAATSDRSRAQAALTTPGPRRAAADLG